MSEVPTGAAGGSSFQMLCLWKPIFSENPVKSIHKLRSSYASLLLSMHCPKKAVQDQLGHAEITTTLEHYHFNPFKDSRKHICSKTQVSFCITRSYYPDRINY
ncbi:MAG: tyrosine-type recombinase/integrase [Lachnospiraceae bacterium]|nr:tyrosine-type recombinase/integrase [Lachnospiraceae bacterium]